MSTRYEEMDEFLKKMALEGKISRESVYAELMNYGLTEEERKEEGLLEEQQRQLEEKYKDDEHGICKQVGYFLVFRDKELDLSRRYLEQSIKLYIPANQEDMKELAPALFDFLSREFI